FPAVAITCASLLCLPAWPAAAIAFVDAPGRAMANPRVASGSAHGFTWQAQSAIVGTGSTATLAAGGNPVYQPSRPGLNGVVALTVDFADGRSGICGGSLLPDRRSILTAAHCVSSGFGTPDPLRATAWFYGGPDGDLVVPGSPPSVAIDIARFSVRPGYTGQVIDQNDIAVLRLADFAPAFARSYAILPFEDLTGRDFLTAGYGRRGFSGQTGDELGAGRLRQGLNRYDFRFGDPDFGKAWTGVFGTAAVDHVWIADFDSGLAPNDASCRVAAVFGLGGSKYCNVGFGIAEVGIARGDSGGPQFAVGRVASVTSFILSLGPEFGDVDTQLNSSFGEFAGFVPTWFHADFIFRSMLSGRDRRFAALAASPAPEPQAWAMLVAGFGLVGLAIRGRRTSPCPAG
ncbi:MAG: trypsin-like serine protease, partial [Thermaurantiacus sp.]